MVFESDWLNSKIERMRAGKSLLDGADAVAQLSEEQVAILRCAAHLHAIEPGASDPEPGFLARLRSRVLSESAGAVPGQSVEEKN